MNTEKNRKNKTEQKKNDLGPMDINAGTSLPIRIFDITSIFLYIGIMGTAFWQLKGYFIAHPVATILACIGGWLFVDLVSGMIHWFFDTWGQYNWPILGVLFVRPFLEHHISPKLITKHDWLETNGSAFFAGFVIVGSMLFFEASYLYLSIGFFTCAWGCLTNQFHKWAHQNPATLPSAVVWLQTTGIILSKETHDVHHRGDNTQHYCITNGFLNKFCDRIGFFRFLEKMVTKATGFKPRDNELPN